MAAFNGSQAEQNALRAELEGLVDDAALVEMAKKRFDALQQNSEILNLVALCNEHEVKTLCEIGTWGGGTNFILAQRVASLELLMGLDLFVRNRDMLHFLKPDSLALELVDGPSSGAKTVESVQKLLAGRPLDFCFIDGDHTYEGVKLDFETYLPLVRPGGLIAFHDINPEQGGRPGPCTGEVPTFWKEIKDQYKVWEFVEDPEEQSGFGIGVLQTPV